MHENAKMTGGGLRKKDLKYNKQGKIVSKKMSQRAKKEKRLEKAGYTTRKGQFGAVRVMKGEMTNAQDVADWIRTVPGIPSDKAEEYATAFIAQGIDATKMDGLSKDDMKSKNLVSNPIHRAKLVSKWKKFRESNPDINLLYIRK